MAANKKTFIVLMIIAVSVSLFLSLAEANPVGLYGAVPAFARITLQTPLNQTYYIEPVQLKFRVITNFVGSYHYILDGKDITVTNVTVTNVEEKSRLDSTNAPGYPYDYWTEYTIDCCEVLAGLSKGSHTLTVYEYMVKTSRSVSFSLVVNPVVSLLSPKGQIFSSQDVPLTFSTDKPPNALSYSLDGQSKVYISGNTTLTGLQNGEHTVEVYAEVYRYNTSRYYLEGFGYVGGYQLDWISARTFFTVNAPTSSNSPSLSPSPTSEPTLEPTQTPIPTLEPTQTATPTDDAKQTLDLMPMLILSGVVLIAVAVGVLVFFKKRKTS